MKKQVFLLILTLTLFTGRAVGQCTVNAGGAMTAICQGGTSAALGGSVGGTATGGTWSTTAGGGFAPSATDLNATWTPPAGYSGTATLVLTATGGTCTTESASKTIVVTPTVGTPVFSLGGTSNRCQAAGTVTYTATASDNTGITYTLDGVSLVGGNTINASTGAVTYAAGWSGTTTITASAAGCSGPSTADHVVTVNPVPVANAIIGATPVCAGTAGVPYQVTTDNTATCSYAWSYSGTNATLGPDANAISIDFASTATSGTLSVIETILATGCHSTNTEAITVSPVSAGGSLTPASSTVCSGTNSTLLTLSSYTGSITKWQYSDDGWTTTHDIPNTNPTYTATNLTITTVYKAVVKSGVCTETTSPDATVNINPLPDNSLSVGGSGTICSGLSTNITVASSVLNVYYQLRDGTTDIGSAVAGTGLPAPIDLPTGALTSTTTFNVLAIDAVTLCSVQLTATALVNVIPLPQGSLTANGPFCVTGAGKLTWTATAGTGPFTVIYDDGSGPQTASGVVSGAPFDPATTPVTSTTTYTLVSVTDAPGCIRTTGFTGSSAAINVYPLPVVTFTAEAGAGPVCAGVDVTYTTQASGTSYSWVFPGILNTDYSITSGGTVASNTVTLKYLTASASRIVTINYTENGCSAASPTPSTATAVNAMPPANAIVGTATLCSGTNGVAYHVTTDNTGPNNYSWSYSGSNVTLHSPLTHSITADYAINATSGTLSALETIVSTGCSRTNTLAITVNQTPSISNQTAAINSGETFTISPVNGPDGIVPLGTTYSWASPSGTEFGGGASGTDQTEISGTLTNTHSTDKTATYTVYPKFGSCTGAPFTVTVTIYGSISITDKTLSVCSGSTFTVAPVDGVDGDNVPSGTVYTWSAPSGSGFTGGASGYRLSDVQGTLANSTADVQTAVYTVTPRANSHNGSTFTITVAIRPLPSATISGTTTVCQNGTDPDITFTNPKSLAETITYNINGGSNTTVDVGPSTIATVAAPTATAGPFTYNLVSVVYQTVPTCSNSLTGSATVTVRPTPSATISGTTTVCQNDAFPNVTFTNPMALPVTVTYKINGGSDLTVNVAGNSTTNVAAPTSTAGPFAYDLVSVVYQTSPTCSNSITGNATITVRPTPTASISGTITVCQNDVNPTITFTNPMALPVTVTYNINGGSDLTINVGASTIATVTAPTTTAGPFIYNLVSVVYQTTPTCSNSLSESATVTVRPTPTATISGTTAVCQNDVSPNITFTNPMSLPVTVTYNINGGSGLTINVGGSTTATVAALTSTPGTFNYNLVSVVYQTSPTCSNSLTGTETITVTPLPTLSGASQAAAVCETYAATINLTGLLPGSISTVNYTINAGGTLSATTTTANGSGAATFTTRTLTAADNGKTLSITGLTTTNATPNCLQTFSQNSILIVNTGSTPTLTGNSTPCVNSTGNVYTTDLGMSNYIWTISGILNTDYSITSGGGTGDNSVTVTWKTAGARTVSINYTNTNGCTGASATGKTVNVQPLPAPAISGPISTCVNSTGNIYTTDAGMLSYTWSIPTGGTIANGGTGNMIIVTWNAAGSQTVNVNYTNANGCTASSATAYGVTVNSLPVPTLSGPATPRVGSTVNVYSTESGMGSYVWSVSGGGTITAGGTSLADTVKVTWNTVGAQTVNVNYTNSNSCTAVSPTTYNVTVKPLPVASVASITGTPAVGSLLTGHYTYTDNNGGTETGTTYRWLRNGTVPISGAVSSTYTPTTSDIDQTITFEVTPASSVGPPYSGSPVQSSPTLSVENLIGVPVVDQICIEGIRAAGDTLKGKYRYIYAYKSEGVSTYQWYLNNIPISGATGLQYIIKQSDIDSGLDITFEVTPVSSNHIPRTGLAVKSNPLARINLTQLSYSIADPAFTLVANVPNGIFSGQGVSNGKFSPAVADTIGSPHNVNYLLNIVNSSTSCSQQDNVSIMVVAIKAYFVGLNPIYCYDGQPFTVTATNIPSGSSHFRFWNSNKNSIIDSVPSLHKVVIDPRKMRHNKTIDTLFFSYYNNSSYFPISQAYQIDSVGVASIKNLNANDTFCNNDAQRVLFPSLTGSGGVGVFKGPVTDSIFKPSMAVGDTAVIFTYTHTNSAHCFSTVRVPIRINPAPVVGFKPLAVCVASTADTTKFLNKTTTSDPVVKWQWQFFDGGGSSTSGLMNPGYLYKNGGSNHVVLTATTNKSCSAQKDSIINIGFRPVTDFYWKNECYHPNDSILFFDATSSKNATILSRTWKFGNSSTDTIGGPLDTKIDVKYLKPSTGYLSVKYIVKTGFSNCNDSITKLIYIRPTISLTAADYNQDFESGQGGWVKDYSTINNWTFGKPTRQVINKAASGVNAWFTSYDTLKQSVDSSSVISPCFDFSTIQRPMISLKLFKRFDNNRDGAVLQYRIKDSAWVNVGSLSDGINWYNSTLIKGKPGGTQMIGWTSSTQDIAWGQSSHTLDDLSGKKDVKFRISYGSDGTGAANEGMAFDDIRIGQRARKVLLEHFTNLSSKASSTANTAITGLATRMAGDVINIQYHTNFPGTDAYYNDNPGDASARFLFYGLSRAPYSFIDGGTSVNFANVYDYVIAPIDSNDLTRRSMINPSFAITLNSKVSGGGILTINGQIKALGAINAENVTLYLVVTEKKNSTQTGANGEKIFYNVFRKLIPDAAGISLQKTWAKNDTYTLTDKYWTIEKIQNNSEIEVIAFIQNNITKEIYQAESNTNLNYAVGIDNVSGNNGKGFSLYPNPASGRLTIEFDETLQAKTEIMIYDAKGIIVRTFITGSGQKEFSIEDLGLKNGLYLVRVKSGGLNWGYKKLIITPR